MTPVRCRPRRLITLARNDGEFAFFCDTNGFLGTNEEVRQDFLPQMVEDSAFSPLMVKSQIPDGFFYPELPPDIFPANGQDSAA